jgi:hypothetical protein
MYFCNNATNISNKPNTSITSFFLTLKQIQYTSSSNYTIEQKLETNDTTWKRTCINGTWNNWIEQINSPGVYYGVCTGQADQQIKNIVISNDQNFPGTPRIGTIFGVKYTASNTYSSTAAAPVKLTFNSGTSQYPIYYKNAVSPTGTATAIYGLANYITYYMFDGTNLVWISQDVDNNTDTKVTQSATPTTGTFDLLMAKTAGKHTAETSTAYKSGANLNYDVANSKLKVGGQNVLTAADIVVCTQAEYDAMSTRTGMLYIITEGAPS